MLEDLFELVMRFAFAILVFVIIGIGLGGGLLIILSLYKAIGWVAHL